MRGQFRTKGSGKNRKVFPVSQREYRAVSGGGNSLSEVHRRRGQDKILPRLSHEEKVRLEGVAGVAETAARKILVVDAVITGKEVVENLDKIVDPMSHLSASVEE